MLLESSSRSGTPARSCARTHQAASKGSLCRPRMNDAIVDLQSGTLAARDLLYVVNQMASTANEAVHNLDSLDSRIRQTMDPAKHTQA